MPRRGRDPGGPGIGACFAKVRYPARRHQHGETAVGETERPDTPSVQLIMMRPFIQHVGDEPPKLGRAAPQLQDLALVVVGVPLVADRSGHETGAGRGQGGVVVAFISAAAAIREHHQRKAADCC